MDIKKVLFLDPCSQFLVSIKHDKISLQEVANKEIIRLLIQVDFTQMNVTILINVQYHNTYLPWNSYLPLVPIHLW